MINIIKNKKSLIITALILTISFVLLLGGCDSSKSGDKKQELEKVVVALDWLPNTNHTGLYAAKEKGYFKEQGLDVEIQQPAESVAPQLVATGKADYGISYQEEVLFARGNEVPVVSIAAVIQHNTACFASPKDKNIKSVDDWVGKTYGGWGGDAENAIVKYLMEKNGHNADSVNIYNMGSADFFTAVEKDVDFSMIFYGWAGAEAEKRKMDLDLLWLKDLDPTFDYYTPVIISSEETLKNKAETTKKFMAALSKGYEYVIENPEEGADILMAEAPEFDKETVLIGQNYLAKEYQADAAQWGLQSDKVWDSFGNWMKEQKFIPEDLDLEAAYSNEYLPKK